MRKLLLTAALVAVPSVALAQVGYLEGAYGVAVFPSIETEDFVVDTVNGELEGSGELTYEQEFSGGLEGGISTGQWRFGASWDFSRARLDSARIVGTLDGVPFVVDGPDDSVESLLGLSFDKRVHIFAANAYYNIGPMDVSVRPYVGLGVGMAAFEDSDTDAELAIHATAGARFALGPRSYVGARYRFSWINGPEDDLGIRYESITLHTFSLLLGVYFGG